MLSYDDSLEIFDLLQRMPRQLSEKTRSYLFAFLDNPTPTAWEDLYCLRLTAQVSVWDAVIEQGYPVVVRHSKFWPSIPTAQMVLFALRYYAAAPTPR